MITTKFAVRRSMDIDQQISVTDSLGCAPIPMGEISLDEGGMNADIVDALPGKFDST